MNPLGREGHRRVGHHRRARRRCTTRWSTRSPTSASATSTCRARPSGSGGRSTNTAAAPCACTAASTPDHLGAPTRWRGARERARRRSETLGSPHSSTDGESSVVTVGTWQVGEVFLSMLWFVLFFIWIWLLISVFIDIFRSHDLSGWEGAVGAVHHHPPVPRRVRVPDRAWRDDARALGKGPPSSARTSSGLRPEVAGGSEVGGRRARAPRVAARPGRHHRRRVRRGSRPRRWRPRQGPRTPAEPGHESGGRARARPSARSGPGTSSRSSSSRREAAWRWRAHQLRIRVVVGLGVVRAPHEAFRAPNASASIAHEVTHVAVRLGGLEHVRRHLQVQVRERGERGQLVRDALREVGERAMVEGQRDVRQARDAPRPGSAACRRGS